MSVDSYNVVRKTPEGKRIVIWDMLSPCGRDYCPINNVCNYNGNGQCVVEKKYIQAVFERVIKDYWDVVEESQLQRAGTLLIPMYLHLIKFKKFELSLSNPTISDHKGNPKVHPIYREIREHIKVINNLWISILGNPIEAEDRGLGGYLNDGDPDYVEEMFRSSGKDKIRRLPVRKSKEAVCDG